MARRRSRGPFGLGLGRGAVRGIHFRGKGEVMDKLRPIE